MPRDGMASGSVLGRVMDASGLPGTGERQARDAAGRSGQEGVEVRKACLGKMTLYSKAL